ncbi:CHAD domain-containing protein [Nocardioides sp. GXQ0305]|uniref:CYTH and CHAD domain-containing protein n=1 Tax=Nocardioides sp. GXQ0305 TaxID=3423912 RepID=UPI003D7D37E7
MLEREFKYDVDGDYALPDLAGVEGVAAVDPAVETALEATYFDTPDHRLSAAGVTLRRRTGGADEGWHLKLPSAEEPEARHELRLGVGRAVRTVPKPFRSTLSGLTGDQPLGPVATVATRRTVRQLRDDQGAVLVEVADDAVEAAVVRADGDGDVPDPIAWREVEVELVDGDAAVLRGVGKQLTSAGACDTTRRSKVGRVLGGEPSPADAPSRAKDPVQALVQHRLATQLGVLLRRDPLARENLPEGVHTMRVAVRRLRSALATCRPFLDRSVTDPLRDELGWLSDVLGDARDAEMRRQRLDAAVDALVAARPDIDWDDQRVRSVLWSSLVDRHQHALAGLQEALASERYAALLDRTRELVVTPPWTDRASQKVGDAYRRRVGHELKRVRRRMAAAADPELTPEERARALHQARKATKRARYAIEPLRPVYGGSAKTLVKRLKKLQSALGQHQDTVVTRGLLLDLARTQQPPLDPAAALLAGALVERESVAAERYEARARKAWRTVRGTPGPG